MGNWKEIRHLINKLTELGTVNRVYSYPLIEVGKRYHPDDFNEFIEESYTTFFYEIPDPFTRRSLSVFLQPSIDRVLVRLSRPSIITSRMSPKTRAKLVNVIYNSCLYEMRRRSETELSEESFVELRRFFENTFFGVQSSIAEMESTNILVFLSFLMALSAIAAILAILYAIPSILTSQQVMYLKSAISIFLLAVIFISICVLSLKR